MSDPLNSAEQCGLDCHRLERVTSWLDDQRSSNRLAGASVLVQRRGKVAYCHAVGDAGGGGEDVRPFERQSIVRLYSMTKPVTTVAAMMLHESGHFQLDEPIARYLPAFARMRVWTGSGALDSDKERQSNTVAAQSPVTVRQLMTHTSGLTYSFMNATPVDQYYRDNGLLFPGAEEPLGSLVERLALAPLLCQPGSQWNYSVSIDVLGRLVELWSGQPLGEFFEQHIFRPLGMVDTAFHVPAEKVDRFADLYGPAAGGDLSGVNSGQASAVIESVHDQVIDEPPVVLDALATTRFRQPAVLHCGGGGLVGTLDDYARFCQMLLNGGELDGKRLLGRKTVEFMRCNQLPDNADMASMGQAVWSESSYQGIGFGLGFAVVLDPVTAGFISSAGEHHWGGAASTFFWIDPAEDLFVVFLTQLYPSSTYPIRQELRSRIYQALVS
ncbi:MAG: serine hydrolase domain-containing protein [Granulosicoccus sp.]